MPHTASRPHKLADEGLEGVQFGDEGGLGEDGLTHNVNNITTHVTVTEG